MDKHSVRKEARAKTIRLAIRRIEKGRAKGVPSGTKLSISSVAREAGIDPATIHTVYPDLAERIRKLAGREIRAQRDEKVAALKALRRRNAALRQEIERLKAEIALVASKYATTLVELEGLQNSQIL